MTSRRKPVRNLRRRALATAALLAAPVLGAPWTVLAAPVGGVITRGSASISTSAGVTQITQTSQRAVIDWSSFNIATGEAVQFTQPGAGAIAFNRVPLGAPMTLAGTLSANGGVWLFSPGGVFINSGARINAGSFVAATASLADVDQAMTATHLVLSPSTASGAGAITLKSGARIDATSGFVLLQAETLNQGGAVSAAGAVSYQASEAGVIDFTETAGAPVLNAVGTSSVAGRGRPAMTHAGSTRAGGHVEIAVPAGQMASGFSAVINLSGVIQADGVAPGGTRGVIILAGSDTARTASGYNGSTTRLDATGATITATHGDVYVTSDSARLGTVTAAGEVQAMGYGAVTLNGPILAGGAMLMQSRSGAVSVADRLVAGGDLIVFASQIAMGGSAVVQTTSSDPASLILLSSSRDFTAAAGSKVLGGSGTGLTNDVLISAGGAITGVSTAKGGSVILGDVSGRSVTVSAEKVGGVGGDVTILGTIHSARDLGVEAQGLLTVASTGVLRSDLSGAGTTAWPVWSTTDVPAVSLAAADLDLKGDVIAGTANAAGDIVINAKPVNKPVTIGGAGGAGGFELTDAEFQHLRGRNVVIEGGAAGGAGGATDMVVDDLTLDATRVSALWLGTGGTGRLLVAGQVLPSGGPVDLNLGFVETPSRSTAPSFIPADIRLTGALGATGARLGVIRMIARGDILMGDDNFVSQAQADPAFDPASQTAGAANAGRVLLAADHLQFTAGGRVLQQNTGAAGTFAGLDIGAPTAETPMMVSPEAVKGVSIGGAPVTFDGASRIVLYGVLRSADGAVWTGASAGYAASAGAEVPLGSNYQMNDCAIGCREAAPPVFLSSTTGVTLARSVLSAVSVAAVYASPAVASGGAGDGEPSIADQAEALVEQAAGAAGKPKNNLPAVANGAASVVRNGGPDQITGSGNRDLWMGRDGGTKP